MPTKRRKSKRCKAKLRHTAYSSTALPLPLPFPLTLALPPGASPLTTTVGLLRPSASPNVIDTEIAFDPELELKPEAAPEPDRPIAVEAEREPVWALEPLALPPAPKPLAVEPEAAELAGWDEPA